MASYLHYERYCPNCARYIDEKRLTCPKCRTELKNINKRFRTLKNGELKNKKLGAYASKKDAECTYLDYDNGKKRRESAIGITFGEVCDDLLRQIKSECKTSSWLDTSGIFNNRFSTLQKKRMTDINKTTLLSFRDTLLKSKYSKNTIFKTWALLGRALRFASLEYNIDQP